MGAALTEYVCNSFDDFVTNCKSFFAANGYSMGEDVGNSFVVSADSSERFLVTKGNISFYFSFVSFGTSGKTRYKTYNFSESLSLLWNRNQNFIGIGIPELVDKARADGNSESFLAVGNIGHSGFPLSLRIFKFDTDALLFCIECFPGIYRFLYVGYIYKNTINGTERYPYFSGSFSLTNSGVDEQPWTGVLLSFPTPTSTNKTSTISTGMFGFFGNQTGFLYAYKYDTYSYGVKTLAICTNYIKKDGSWFGLNRYSSENNFLFYGSFASYAKYFPFSNESVYRIYNINCLGIISEYFSLSSLNSFPLLFDSIIFDGMNTLKVFGYIPDIYISLSNGNINFQDVTLGNANYKIVPIIESTENKNVLGSFAIKMG